MNIRSTKRQRRAMWKALSLLPRGRGNQAGKDEAMIERLRYVESLIAGANRLNKKWRRREKRKGGKE